MSSQQPVARVQLLAYGVPGLPLALLSLPLVVYLPAYYTERPAISLLALGGAVFAARLLDIVTDPLIGTLSDRLKQRGISRRLLMILGTPVLVVGIQQLFVAPVDAGVGYLFTWNLVTYLGWTLLYVPYLAWGAELSGGYHARTQLAGSREGFGIIGIFAAIALPTILGIADQPGAVLDAAAQVAWLLLPVAVLIAVFKAPEPTVTRSRAKAPVMSWFHLLTMGRVRRLITAYLLSSAANALPASLFLFYVTHVLESHSSTGLFLTVYFISGVVALPAWIAISRRLGKTRTWTASMLLACAAFSWAPWLQAGDELAFLVICVVTGVSLGADMALPAALQADLTDDADGAVAGQPRAGLLFGLWGLATKLAGAVGIGIAFLALYLLGFDPQGTNSEPTLQSLALLYGLVPVLLKVVSILLITGFKETVSDRQDSSGDPATKTEANHVDSSSVSDRSNTIASGLHSDAT